MESDTPLKELFRMRARDLLPLTNDAGAEVEEVAHPVNVQAARGAVDFAICLRRGTERYVRHLEFQSEHRRILARRFFEYAAALTRHFKKPVLTTVLYVHPPAPSELVYRQVLAGRVVNQWRFDVVQLWEQPAERLLALGPGGAALVPLCRGATLPQVAAASRRIQRGAPPAGAADLLAILQMLSEGRYTARQLARVIPQELVMDSTLLERYLKKRVAKSRNQWRAEGRTEGRTEGRAEGRAEEARNACATLTRALHPTAAPRLVPVIRACSELAQLRLWTRRAPRLSDAEFASLVTGRKTAGLTRRRAPRPARKATRPGTK
jgi:hypothetical protein